MKHIPLLFENDFCMVLNKPSGLAVQGGVGVKSSLDSILSEKFNPRPLLVHRLDKDTSGAILVAKTKEAAASFSNLFSKEGSIAKYYLGICSGIPLKKEGLISLDLEVRLKGQKSQKSKLKKSRTFFRLLSNASAQGFPYSLLELELGTGRMHQIRRHLALIGHPLLGDDKYGDFALNKKLKKTKKVNKLLLHAHRLIIPPILEIPGGLDITAPPPEYFSSWL